MNSTDYYLNKQLVQYVSSCLEMRDNSKKSFQNPDFEAIYFFSVNTYQTSAVAKCIP